MKQPLAILIFRVASSALIAGVLAGLALYKSGQPGKYCVAAGAIAAVQVVAARLTPAPSQEVHVSEVPK